MNFLTLPDYFLSILFENEDIIAIDKPYGFNAHTNDSKIEHSDFIKDGLIELYEKQLNRKLHIIHRLDQTTTGVMIFGKSTDSAKKYADFFLNRQVKKTYWFITGSKSAKLDFLINTPILHKGGELEAQTQLKLLKTDSFYGLWQANPFTGRNHQIRIHAKQAEISILGDVKYGGADFPFLLLHNHRIEFPNDIVIVSQAPEYFYNLALLQDQFLARSFFERDRRLRLFAHSDIEGQCFRLVHSVNYNKEIGFTLDQMGKILVLNWFKERWSEQDRKRFLVLSEKLNKPILVRMLGDRAKIPISQKSIFIIPNGVDPAIVLPKAWEAKENSINYELRSDSGQSIGLFTDQRLQRNWVLRNSSGKSVLSLFASTGCYGLAAVVGNAVQVTSVESSKNNLNWAKKNFELNGLEASRFLFYCRDSLSFLEQCINKEVKYDLIVCDVPSFVRREKAYFKIETGLEELLKNCLQCLNTKGELLVSIHYEGFYIDEIRKIILKAQQILPSIQVKINCILPALDFELPNEKANLKSFLICT
jgi:23S rRNA (cytosine1962-C5)-methyltransferase